MIKIITVSLILLSSVANAQEVIPGKLRYYSNSDVAKITQGSNAVVKDVRLYKYDNAVVSGGKDVKLHKYSNEDVAGQKNIKLHKYDNEAIAKSIGTNSLKLKRYETNFDVPVVGKVQNRVQNIPSQNQNLNNNNLSFDGKNQSSAGKIKPIK